MAEVRSKRNAVKIESWRLSRIPTDPTADIYQGDMIAWSPNHGYAIGAPAASGASFIGVSDTSTKVATLGVLTADQQLTRVNAIQEGLCEFIVAAGGGTVKPFDPVYIGADAQTVALSGSNSIGFVDPGFVGGGTKAVAAGDLILVWIKVPAAFKSV